MAAAEAEATKNKVGRGDRHPVDSGGNPAMLHRLDNAQLSATDRPGQGPHLGRVPPPDQGARRCGRRRRRRIAGSTFGACVAEGGVPIVAGGKIIGDIRRVGRWRRTRTRKSQRRGPTRCGERRGGGRTYGEATVNNAIMAIHGDVHPTVPDMKAPAPYSTTSGASNGGRARHQFVEMLTYPPHAPLTARPEWRGKNGRAARPRHPSSRRRSCDRWEAGIAIWIVSTAWAAVQRGYGGRLHARSTTGSPRNGLIAIRGCGPRSSCRCRTRNMRSTRSSAAPGTGASCRSWRGDTQETPLAAAIVADLRRRRARRHRRSDPRWLDLSPFHHLAGLAERLHQEYASDSQAFQRQERTRRAKACSPNIRPQGGAAESGVTWLPGFRAVLEILARRALRGAGFDRRRRRSCATMSASTI